jgi:4-hydroxyphenylacetate 3-hydroxylase, reductase component
VWCDMNLEARAIRDALGDFPTGVVIATARTADGRPLGITVSSFNSVSLDPPLILFSIARSSKSFAEWMLVDEFAISILHEEHDTLSTKFGRSAPDKWDAIDGATGQGGMKVVPDALALFECSCYARYDGGDHVIFVGLVNSIVRSQEQKGPLVFFRGAYRTLHDRDVTKPKNRSQIVPDLDWDHSGF